MKIQDVGKYLLIAGAVWGAWYLYRNYGGKLPVIPNDLTNSNNSNSNTNTENSQDDYRTLEQILAIKQQHPDWKMAVQNNKDHGYIAVFFDADISKILDGAYYISEQTFNTLIARGCWDITEYQE